MRALLLFHCVALLVSWFGSTAAHATHTLGADLTYAYAGTGANPFQYRVTARLFNDNTAGAAPPPPQLMLNYAMNGCGSAGIGSTNATLVRTNVLPVPSTCSSANPAYLVVEFEGLVQLPPAQWTLSIDVANRVPGIVNMTQSANESTHVRAVVNSSPGLFNSSPRFTITQLIQLTGAQLQRYSMNAFDAEGDSLAYQLVPPLSSAGFAVPCGQPLAGALAPHFQLNAATGELLTVASGPLQLGRYVLAVQVNEFRRIAGTWIAIGSIRRDMTYSVTAGANRVPAFTRVAPAGSPTSQLMGQTIRVAAGQTASLLLTATDPDAGQLLAQSSSAPALVPGATFQPQGTGQGLLTWQVPATLPPGRYAFTAAVFDNACPVPGGEVLTLSFMVTPQVLATRARQPLAQAPFPMPFAEEVRFTLAGVGAATVTIVDGLGRTVTQLMSGADGGVQWRPSAALPAGLYLARNASGTQVARLLYSGR